jgi:MFS family permease
MASEALANQPQVKKVLWRYNAFQMFFNLLLWIPVFYQFQKQIGLDDPQIFRIQSVYYLVFCFLEIPTGAFADRFGYKQSMLWGSMTLCAANLLPVMQLAPYFSMMTHFMLIALARSLISGASSAWLYEWLKHQPQADGEAASVTEYKTFEGNARFYSLLGRVLCWAAVGYLMKLSIYLPYLLSALNAGLAFVFAFTLPNLPALALGNLPGTETPTPGRIAKAFSSASLSINILQHQPLILLYMAQGVGIFVMIRILQVNLYQPILISKAFAVTTFGIIMSVMTIFEAVGSRITGKIRGRISLANMVGLMSMVLSVCLATIATGNQIVTIVSLCVFSLAAGLVFPVQKQLLNDSIQDSRVRATLLSTESILDRAICAVAVLPLGGLVLKGKLQLILLVCAASTALAIFSVHLMVKFVVKRQQTP